MASLPYPRTPLFPRLHPSFPTLAPLFLPLHALLFPFHPISFPLHTPYFCHPHRPTQMLVSTDADARIDRRRHPHRPTQTSAPTDADIRTDRRRCSYRPARMTFVDVSQCQTFTFTKRSVQLVYGRALTKTDKTPYCGQTLLLVQQAALSPQ